MEGPILELARSGVPTEDSSRATDQLAYMSPTSEYAALDSFMRYIFSAVILSTRESKVIDIDAEAGPARRREWRTSERVRRSGGWGFATVSEIVPYMPWRRRIESIKQGIEHEG